MLGYCLAARCGRGCDSPRQALPYVESGVSRLRIWLTDAIIGARLISRNFVLGAGRMDTSVALVETYLRMNGYFTVAEFPIVARVPGPQGHTELRTRTDLDILAFRFPRAQHLVPAAGTATADDREAGVLDEALGVSADVGDMIIGEVKEGVAELNAAARDPAVLRAALARFGCCSAGEAARAARELLHVGSVELRHGHRARLVAFGSVVPSASAAGGPSHCVALPHVFDYLRRQIARDWNVMKAGGTKDEALGWLLLEEKARRASLAGAAR